MGQVINAAARFAARQSDTEWTLGFPQKLSENHILAASSASPVIAHGTVVGFVLEMLDDTFAFIPVTGSVVSADTWETMKSTLDDVASKAR